MIDLVAFATNQQALGIKATRKPEVIQLPGDRKQAVMFDPSTGTLLSADAVDLAKFEPEPGPRDHTAHTLESFTDMVTHFNADKGTTRDAAVFVSMTEAVCVLDTADRREALTFPLATTPTWSRLRGLVDGSAMTQAAFIDLLRRQMDALFTPGDLLKTVRTLKFVQNTDADSNIQQGKASIGRRVQSELTGAGALPDDVTVNAPVWSNVFFDDLPMTRDVLCVLDVDLADQKFLLRPKAGQIENHERAALERLVAEIRAKVPTHVKVYAGVA